MKNREETTPIVCSETRARELLADVSARTVRRLGESGAIHTGMLGGRRVYVVESIQDYVRRSVEAGQGVIERRAA